jgi:hypothetical protein
VNAEIDDVLIVNSIDDFTIFWVEFGIFRLVYFNSMICIGFQLANSSPVGHGCGRRRVDRRAREEAIAASTTLAG